MEIQHKVLRCLCNELYNHLEKEEDRDVNKSSFLALAIIKTLEALTKEEQEAIFEKDNDLLEFVQKFSLIRPYIKS